MSDSAIHNVQIVNSALANTAIERARRVQRKIEEETRDIGLEVRLYPSLDVDFLIVVEADDGEWIGELECVYNESGRDWLRGARAIVALHRSDLAACPPPSPN